MSNTITAPVAAATAPAIVPVAPIKATKAVKAQIDRLRVLRSQKAAIEAETKALSAEILAYAGSQKRAITWGATTLASIVESSSTITDTKALAQAFPEAYAACVSQKPYSQVR